MIRPRTGIVLARQFFRNWRMITLARQRKLPFFSNELQALTGRDQEWLYTALCEYASTPAAWYVFSSYRSDSRHTDGIAKTLDVAEGFALWALVKHARPKVVVELGSQYGISARLWKEALRYYVPNHELILCDLEDQRRYIGSSEATFLKGDARVTLQQVFATRRVDILHNDAHPYDRIRWSLEEGLRRNIPIFTFHDIGRGKRGPFRRAGDVSQSEKQAYGEDYGRYGTWERHVMAEVFDRRILDEDAVQNERAVLQCFDSLFGVAVVIVRSADEQ